MKKKAEKIRHKIQTDYLEKVYSKQFLKLVPRAVKKLQSIMRKHPFDAIAFTGSSGAALAYPLSYFLKIPLIHVRKGASHYGGGKIEGTISSKRYVIIDDFIETGASIRRVIRTVNSELEGAKPVAICLYSSTRTDGFDNKGKYIPVFTITTR
jgi:orotate phosphoribosyltransferase